MTQDPLFVESIEEALRDAVNALKGPKAVGIDLWPEMSADLAGRRLNQCLDPERSEKLELSQVLLIAKRARARNCHTLMTFLCRELNYEAPKAVDPRDEYARLQAKFVSAVEENLRMGRELQASLAAMQTTVAQFPGRRAA